jgi:hypothetical protein
MIGGFLSVLGVVTFVIGCISFIVAVACFLSLVEASAKRGEESNLNFLLNFSKSSPDFRALTAFWAGVLICLACSWYFIAYLQPTGKGFKSTTVEQVEANKSMGSPIRRNVSIKQTNLCRLL